MPFIKTKDGVEIFYKDWGKGQPIVFSHGWPLSSDDWDAQMMFFLNHGFRVVAHDRRGHGRSTQVADGHDMDHYADDLAAVVAHLDLKDAVHVGHSTGGGEVVHYLARHGESRAAKGALLCAVPPLMVKTPANPGRPAEGRVRRVAGQLAANRSQFYRDVPAGPFYGFNRPGAKASGSGLIQNWWRQGMMGGAKAHYDGIVAFSQTDFTEDLKKITIPVLVMHSEDDQIVPYADSGPLVGQAPQERHAEDLQGLPARHADHARRHDQRRPAGLHQGLTLRRCLFRREALEVGEHGGDQRVALGVAGAEARGVEPDDIARLLRRFRPVCGGRGNQVGFELLAPLPERAFVGFDLGHQAARAGRLLGGEAATLVEFDRFVGHGSTLSKSSLSRRAIASSHPWSCQPCRTPSSGCCSPPSSRPASMSQSSPDHCERPARPST